MKRFAILSVLMVLVFVGCVAKPIEVAVKEVSSELTLATTTSTENTGLLSYLLPVFEQENNVTVRVVAVGTGQAIALGENGDADVLLVHDTKSEEKFVADGFADRRDNVMYNDFVLLGSSLVEHDVLEPYKSDIDGAFKLIYQQQLPFVSRGDDSGTDKAEKRIWERIALGNYSTMDWYYSTGSSMGNTLNTANELKAYTLSDRGTFLAMKKDVELEIVVEHDAQLQNQYGVLVVNKKGEQSKAFEDAQRFREWILSKETQDLIEAFGKDEYGQSLFFKNATPTP